MKFLKDFSGLILGVLILTASAYAKPIFQYHLAAQSVQKSAPNPEVVPAAKPFENARQVRYEVKIVEVNRSSLQAKGIQFETLAGGLKVALQYGGNNTVSELSQVLQWFGSQGDANILAQPSLLALEGETSRIQIGDRLPVAVPASQSSGSGTILWKLDYIDSGVILRLKTLAVGSADVVAELETEVSHIRGWTSTQAGSFPILSTRKAEAVLRMSFENSAVIAGLIDENEYNTQSGLPLLSDLPLLGFLFQHQKLERQKSEILILVKPELAS